MRSMSVGLRRRTAENPVSFGRSVTASLMVVVGGIVATLLGLYGPSNYHPGFTVGHLLAILFVSGITLILAGLVDGGRRYLGAGIGLLYVAVSASVISHAPDWLGQGWFYGMLFIAWGTVAVIRLLSQRSREGTPERSLVGETRPVSPPGGSQSEATAPGEPAAAR